MALRTRKPEKPVSELTTKELEKRISLAQKTVQNLPPPEASAEERKAALARGQVVVQEVPELRAELARRERLARHRETEKAALKGGYERTREVLAPGVIEGFQRLGQDIGLKLDVKKLDAAERSAVLKLWSAVLAGDASIEERAEFEALVEKAAGKEPGFFDERRKQAQTKRQLAELKEEAHMLTLPRRRRFEEPGAITLPRVVFSQLQSTKSGHWGISDVGCLATVLSCFLEKRTLIRDSAFEERDGEVVLVARGQISRLAFENRVNPNTAYAVASSGWVDLPASLERLVANNWFDVRELRGGIVEIRLGTAARKLLEEGSTASG